MHRKATFMVFVTRREMLYVGDTPDHSLMLTEMEGEALDYTPGEAGKFISRRSVGFHDRTKGEGPMEGYAVTHYENGAVFSRFEGARKEGVTAGTWKVYKGIGKLSNLKGSGTFTVKSSGKPNEFILDMQGEYVL
jgi:ribosomal protein L35AE/L33A